MATAAQITKLDGIEANANNYSLPTATDVVKGGVKTASTGGLKMVSDIIVQDDSRLTSDTPVGSDEIAFWDVGGNDQNNTTIQELVQVTLDPSSITTTANCANAVNFYTTASGNKTITFSNIPDGASGQLTINYSSASVITIAESDATVTDVKIADNIWNSTGDQIKSKSSGYAVYSYYKDGTNLFIFGTQTFN